MSENSQTETTQPNPAPVGAANEPAPAPTSAAPSLEEQRAAAKKEAAANYDR